MFDKGFLGEFFDFNGDGKLDAFEQAAELCFLCEISKEKDKPVDTDCFNSDCLDTD